MFSDQWGDKDVTCPLDSAHCELQDDSLLHMSPSSLTRQNDPLLKTDVHGLKVHIIKGGEHDMIARSAFADQIAEIAIKVLSVP